MSAAGADNVNADANNLIFTIKEAILCSYRHFILSAKENQKLSKLLSKGFERSVYWNEYKTKSENKNTTNEYRYFNKSNFVGFNRSFALICLNRDNDVKQFKAWRYYLLKGTIKNDNVMKKSFMTKQFILI